MRVWFEIEYTNKEGQSVHSDVCVPEEEARKDLPEYLIEILEMADFSKDWSLHSNGVCSNHPSHALDGRV